MERYLAIAVACVLSLCISATALASCTASDTSELVNLLSGDCETIYLDSSTPYVFSSNIDINRSVNIVPSEGATVTLTSTGGAKIVCDGDPNESTLKFRFGRPGSGKSASPILYYYFNVTNVKRKWTEIWNVLAPDPNDPNDPNGILTGKQYIASDPNRFWIKLTDAAVREKWSNYIVTKTTGDGFDGIAFDNFNIGVERLSVHDNPTAYGDGIMDVLDRVISKSTLAGEPNFPIYVNSNAPIAGGDPWAAKIADPNKYLDVTIMVEAGRMNYPDPNYVTAWNNIVAGGQKILWASFPANNDLVEEYYLWYIENLYDSNGLTSLSVEGPGHYGLNGIVTERRAILADNLDKLSVMFPEISEMQGDPDEIARYFSNFKHFWSATLLRTYNAEAFALLQQRTAAPITITIQADTRLASPAEALVHITTDSGAVDFDAYNIIAQNNGLLTGDGSGSGIVIDGTTNAVTAVLDNVQTLNNGDAGVAAEGTAVVTMYDCTSSGNYGEAVSPHDTSAITIVGGTYSSPAAGGSSVHLFETAATACSLSVSDAACTHESEGSAAKAGNSSTITISVGDGSFVVNDGAAFDADDSGGTLNFSGNMTVNNADIVSDSGSSGGTLNASSGTYTLTATADTTLPRIGRRINTQNFYGVTFDGTDPNYNRSLLVGQAATTFNFYDCTFNFTNWYDGAIAGGSGTRALLEMASGTLNLYRSTVTVGSATTATLRKFIVQATGGSTVNLEGNLITAPDSIGVDRILVQYDSTSSGLLAHNTIVATYDVSGTEAMDGVRVEDPNVTLRGNIVWGEFDYNFYFTNQDDYTNNANSGWNCAYGNDTSARHFWNGREKASDIIADPNLNATTYIPIDANSPVVGGDDSGNDVYLKPRYTFTIQTTPYNSGTYTFSPDVVVQTIGGSNGYGRETNNTLDMGCFAPDGLAVAVTAVPNKGYILKSWSGDASGNQNPYTVTVNGNVNVTANLSNRHRWRTPWSWWYRR